MAAAVDLRMREELSITSARSPGASSVTACVLAVVVTSAFLTTVLTFIGKKEGTGDVSLSHSSLYSFGGPRRRVVDYVCLVLSSEEVFIPLL